MIKINLAGKAPRSFEGTNVGITAIAGGGGDLEMVSSSDLQKQGVLRLVGLLLGPMALFAFQSYNLPGKSAKLAQVQSELSRLESRNLLAKNAVDEYKKFKENETKLQAQISTIDGLRKDRQNEVQLLDLIQKQIPEKMWLSKLEIREGKINFQGVAYTDSELTGFMEALSRSPLISKVNLIKSTEQTSGSLIVKKFDIECALSLLQGGKKEGEI